MAHSDIMCGWILQELAVVAADLGLEYGLEVVNRYETNLINTASRVFLLLPSVEYRINFLAAAAAEISSI